jgi:hypothetical protein
MRGMEDGQFYKFELGGSQCPDLGQPSSIW